MKEVEQNATDTKFGDVAENSCEGVNVTMSSEPDDTASLSDDSDLSEREMESNAIEYSKEELKHFVKGLNLMKRKEEIEFQKDNLDFNEVRKYLKQKRIAKPNSANICFASAECDMFCGKTKNARRLILRGYNLCDPSKWKPWAKALLLYCRTVKISNPMSNETAIDTAYHAIEDSLNSHEAKDDSHGTYHILFQFINLSSMNKNDLESLIKKFPLDCRLWILLSVAEELQGESDERINEIIDQALLAQADHGEEIDGDKWIAIADEIKGPRTSQAIIDAVVGIYFRDGKGVKIKLIKLLECTNGFFFTSTTRICNHLYQHIPSLRNFFIRCLFDDQKLKSVSNSENTEYFSCLLDASCCWKSRLYKGAQDYFTEAFALSSEIKDVLSETYIIFSREWMEREPKLKTATSLARDALALNQTDYAMELYYEYKIEDNEFWILKGQTDITRVHQRKGNNNFEKAKKSFEIATRQRGKFITFLAWLFQSEIEENYFRNLPKAREVLERGRRGNSNSEIDFDIALIHFEARAGNQQVAKDILNRALTKYCCNERVWAEAIFMEPREARRLKAVEAAEAIFSSKNSKADSKKEYILLAVANNFFSQGELRKARKWFNKTVETYPWFFDAWAYFYRLELLWGTEESAEEVLRRCRDARPKFGFKWKYFENKSIEHYWLFKVFDRKNVFLIPSCELYIKILPLFAKSLLIPGAEPEYLQKTKEKFN